MGRDAIAGRMRDGESDVADQLIPLLYTELRGIAANCLRGERAGHTLQPTAQR